VIQVRSNVPKELAASQAPTTDEARRILEEVVIDLAGAASLPAIARRPKTEGAPRFEAPSAQEAEDTAAVLERRMEQTIRAMRREASGRGSEAAIRVLGNDSLRLLIESVAWRRVASWVSGASNGTTPAGARGTAARSLANARKLIRLLTSDEPTRHRRIAALALSSFEPPVGQKAEPRPLMASEASALVEILSSTDPKHGAVVRECLAHGDSIENVREALVERLVPPSLEGHAVEAKAADGARMAGLRFDLGTNQWVPVDRSWAYSIRLGQLFDYHVVRTIKPTDEEKAQGIGPRSTTVIEGKEELKARMLASAIDPTSGEPTASSAEINGFVEELASAASAADAGIERLLSTGFSLCFATTDGGDTPVAALWELPNRAMGDLFAAMADPTFRDHLRDVAAQEDAARAERRNALTAPLAELLAKYPGVPRLHKRAHGALINLGLAGQSVAEMGREDGVLPRSKTVLEPASLKERFADATDVKMRFLFTDEFELIVLTEEMFAQVVKEYGFPPNHEMLSYNHPIAGSGYLTIDHGKIVALEDDITMLPGKMPAGLPPAFDVLRARGFDLDEEKIAKSSFVIDFETLKGLAGAPKGATPEPLSESLSVLRERLEDAAPPDVPKLVISILRSELAKQRIESSGNEMLAQERTAEFAAKLLEGFRIINVASRDFKNGDLPTDKSEFDDLMVDERLAPYLVRKVSA
jgi:hypothetical protein